MYYSTDVQGEGQIYKMQVEKEEEEEEEGEEKIRWCDVSDDW